METTDWYPENVKPIHKGWYECRCCNHFYYWCGDAWRHSKTTKYRNAVYGGWRGLTKQMKEKS